MSSRLRPLSSNMPCSKSPTAKCGVHITSIQIGAFSRVSGQLTDSSRKHSLSDKHTYRSGKSKMLAKLCREMQQTNAEQDRHMLMQMEMLAKKQRHLRWSTMLVEERKYYTYIHIRFNIKHQFSSASFSSSVAPAGVSFIGKVSSFSHIAPGP